MSMVSMLLLELPRAVFRAFPIRLRLTASFAIIGSLLLVAGGAVMYYRLQSELDRGLDSGLRARSADVTLLMRGANRATPIARLPANDETIAQVLDASGRVLDATRTLAGESALTRAQLAGALRGATFVDHPTLRGTDEQIRLLARPISIGGQRRIVVVGATLEGRNEALASLRREFLVGLPFAVLLATAGAFVVASAALRPVGALRRDAEAITRTGPSARLAEPRARDEIGELARTLNAMLARLEAAGARERRFVADASHELRAPLALVQSELEVTLSGPRQVVPYRRALLEAEREVAGLAQLSNDLLLLARADEDRLPLRPEPVEPRTILESLARRFAQRAGAEHRAIRVEHADDGAIDVDRLRLEQALANLVENALRHGSGDIRLTARRVAGMVELGVHDGGRGFPEGFRSRAFERFARADPARSGPGAGLGLAIVDLIARAHGGEPYIEQDATHCEVGMRIPVAPALNGHRSV
jgi:signal transduction histidine kinase